MASADVTRRIRVFFNGKEINNTIKEVRGEFIRLNNHIQKNLIPGTKEYNKEMKRLSALDAILVKHRKKVKGISGGWSRIKNLALGYVSGTAIIGGLRKLGQALSRNLETVKEFNQAQADTAAVLGKTIKETKALTIDAQRLGASTKFTAVEVSKLQKEYAKLGFTESEILKTTEATLNLAAATNTDLSEAAAVAGATVRGFGLDASETGRVTDVMALSFSSSALDLEKFKESMKTAAPIAKAAGLPIEKTTAVLGKMADAGISGSIAGTSLKKIFNELAKDGKPLNESLEDVRSALEKAATPAERLAVAEGLVGERAQAALLVLADQTDGIGELETALNGASGAAAEMAAVQLDTLAGDVTKLSSAWDGFILGVENGEGAIGGAVRSVLQFSTNTLGLFTNTNKLSDAISDEQNELNVLVTQLKNAGDGTDRRRKIITELNDKYPDFLKNMDQEKLTNEQLTARLQEVNKQYIAKILIQEKQEEIEAAAQKQAEKGGALLRREKEELTRLVSLEKELLGATQESLTIKERTRQINKAINDQGKGGFFGERLFNTRLLEGKDFNNSLEESEKLLGQQSSELEELQKRFEDILPPIKEFQDEVTGGNSENNNTGADTSDSDKTIKAAEKTVDDLTNLISELDDIAAQQAFERSIAGFDKINEQEARAIRAVDKKYAALEEKAKGNSVQEQEIARLKNEALNAIELEYEGQRIAKAEEAEAALLEKKNELLAELEAIKSGASDDLTGVDKIENDKNSALSTLDTELGDKEARAKALLTNEEELQDALTVLKEEGERKRKQITEDSNDAERILIDENNRKREEIARIAIQSVSGVLNFIGEITGKQAKTAKASALFEIGVSSAVAIANAIKSASVVPFPGNIAAIATSLGVVGSNIARARKIVNESKEPEIPEYGQGDLFNNPLEGPSHNSPSRGLSFRDRLGKVRARLEGGEFIMRKSAVNAETIPYLRQINNTGSIPNLDTAGYAENLALERAGVFNRSVASRVIANTGADPALLDNGLAQGSVNQLAGAMGSQRVILVDKDRKDFATRKAKIQTLTTLKAK
ncbi:MAG: phage tail tape measure protein [Aureispira sp.]